LHWFNPVLFGAAKLPAEVLQVFIGEKIRLAHYFPPFSLRKTECLFKFPAFKRANFYPGKYISQGVPLPKGRLFWLVKALGESQIGLIGMYKSEDAGIEKLKGFEGVPWDFYAHMGRYA
jgi:hypothetical protein